MRTPIPEFNKEIGPLKDSLEKYAGKVSKRSKNTLPKVSLDHLCTEVHEKAFNRLQNELENTTSL